MTWDTWLTERGINPDSLEPGATIDLTAIQRPQEAQESTEPPTAGNPTPRRLKYNNKRNVIDGFVFDSIAESTRYGQLKLMQMSGTISSLRIHPTYVVFDSFTDNQGEKHRSIRYIADFEYIQDGKYIVEDVKGGSATQTAVFRIKRKMFLARYRDRALRIVEV